MKTDQRIRLENLIKSGQNVSVVCQSEYSINCYCGVYQDNSKVKCNYLVDGICTYPPKIEKGYN